MKSLNYGSHECHRMDPSMHGVISHNYILLATLTIIMMPHLILHAYMYMRFVTIGNQKSIQQYPHYLNYWQADINTVLPLIYLKEINYDRVIPFPMVPPGYLCSHMVGKILLFFFRSLYAPCSNLKKWTESEGKRKKIKQNGEEGNRNSLTTKHVIMNN